MIALTMLLFSTGCGGPPADAGLAATDRDWPHYLGDPGSTQYSTLDQVNRSNVSRLKVAWTFDTGDVGEYQANNLIIRGILYTVSPDRYVFALNAATGDEIWRFDPRTEGDENPGNRQRGLMYWEDGEDRRIYTPAGSRLYALDAETGRLVRSFGTDGSIDLGTGLRAAVGSPTARLNTPGYVYEDMIIIGAQVNSRQPGGIRAFDTRTGEHRWTFHTIPFPGEYGYETWPPDAWKKTGAVIGGASDWSGIAIDEERGIVYASTETAGPDLWGGERFGENLFANSVIAIDARTGKRLWHYQLVHHDLWDMDLPTPPTLLTVTHEGRRIDAVAQGTKMGTLFVFDRVSGEPLWPIENRLAPRSEIPGVRTWPTQPFPTKPPPLMRMRYTMDDVSDVSPQARIQTAERLRRAGAYGSFPPPSWRESIIFPGFDGGFEWGGSAADPGGILYVNVSEMPWIYQLVPTVREDGSPLTPGERQYRIHCGTCHGIDRVGDPAGGMPSLVDVAKNRTREHVETIIEQGMGRMPPFGRIPDNHMSIGLTGRLNENQLGAIVDYLFATEAPAEASGSEGAGGREADEAVPPYTLGGMRRWFDHEGYPAIKPPWGTLNAVDLNTGEIRWRVPLGEYPELTGRGIPPTGTENYGGPVVTAGGLIFIGATADETFRAFDKDTGEILWQHELPFGGNATPSTYMVDGRQYVVISAGGGKTGRPAGGRIVAFALSN
jgi:quinoprotein glucose dehydrogenase